MDRYLWFLHQVPQNNADQANQNDKYEWYATTIFVAFTPQEFLHVAILSCKWLSQFKALEHKAQKEEEETYQKHTQICESKILYNVYYGFTYKSIPKSNQAENTRTNEASEFVFQDLKVGSIQDHHWVDFQ